METTQLAGKSFGKSLPHFYQLTLKNCPLLTTMMPDDVLIKELLQSIKIVSQQRSRELQTRNRLIKSKITRASHSFGSFRCATL